MSNQQPGKPHRITVAEAFRLVSEIIRNNADKFRYPDDVALFAITRFLEEGEDEGEPTEAFEERIDGKSIALANRKASFLAFCQATGTKPRNLHNPWAADSYTGEDDIQDFRHDISYEEFERWSAPYRPLIQQPKSTSTATVSRLPPQGGDSLTRTIWEVCYDIADAKGRPTPVPVMADLKIRAESGDAAKRGPLLSSTAGGVKWEYAKGDERELNATQLQARINEWKRANGIG